MREEWRAGIRQAVAQCLYIGGAALSCWAFSYNSFLLEHAVDPPYSFSPGTDLPDPLNSVGTGMASAVMLCLFYLGNREADRIRRTHAGRRGDGVAAAILAALFACFMMIGGSMKFSDALVWDGHRIKLFLVFLGFLFAFLSGLTVVFRAVYFMDGRALRPSGRSSGARGFLRRFSVLCLAWSPYLVAFFPGTIQFDAMVQINNYFGVFTWSSHHPVFSTMLMGFAISFGRLLGSDNIGIFLYVLIQYLLLAAAFAYLLQTCEKRGAPRSISVAGLLYFALFPIWGIYAVTVIKDVSYMIFFLLFVAVLLRIENRRQPMDTGMILAYGGTVLLMSLTWHEGIIVCTVTTAALLLFRKAIRKGVGLAFCGALGVLLLFNRLLVPALGIVDFSSASYLCIPLQQTGRYVSLHREEVTEEERAAIDRVIRFDEIEGSYHPECSDGMKNLVHVNLAADPGAYADYFGTWLRQGLKHPSTYLQATIHNSYGYFYPDRTEWLDGIGYYRIEDHPAVNLGATTARLLPGTERARTLLQSVATHIRNFPGIGMLYSCGIHTWALLTALTMLLARREKRRLSLLLLPMLMTLAVCVASPVNAYIRYLLPVMAALPAVVSTLFFRDEQQEDRNG